MVDTEARRREFEAQETLDGFESPASGRTDYKVIVNELVQTGFPPPSAVRIAQAISDIGEASRVAQAILRFRSVLQV